MTFFFSFCPNGGVLMAIFGALVSAGLSALSAFGAQKSAKKQAKVQAANDYIANLANAQAVARKNEQNYALGVGLINRADAMQDFDFEGWKSAMKSSGYNPVTFLNAGTMAYFDHRAEKANLISQGYQYLSPEISLVNASQAVKVPDTMEVLGSALSAGWNSYQADVRQEKAQAFQSALLDKRLSALQQKLGQGRSMSALGVSAPVISTAGSASRRQITPGLSLSGGASAPGSDLGIHIPEADKSKYSNPWSFYNSKIDLSTPNADAWADRYGDIAEEVFGVYNLASDSLKNLTGRTIPLALKEAALWATNPGSIIGPDRQNYAPANNDWSALLSFSPSANWNFLTRNVPESPAWRSFWKGTPRYKTMGQI